MPFIINYVNSYIMKKGYEIIEEILEDLDMKAPTFAKHIGVSYQRISDIQRKKTKNISGELANAIKAKYPQYDIAWLLTGEGSMLIDIQDKIEFDTIVQDILEEHGIKTPLMKTYPLISIEAVAGFGTEDNAGVTYEDCEQYAVPDFEAKGMEFLIRVSGSSMYPKYSSGDVLACRKITEILFFQWGKVYVVDSSQGQLVKRIFEDESNPDNILCVSENKEKYPPFKMPKSDIRSVSLVLGAIKLD